MKAIYITAYGNSTQDLKLIEVSEPDTPSCGRGWRNACVRLRNTPGSIG
jgi:hypothetical protein